MDEWASAAAEAQVCLEKDSCELSAVLRRIYLRTLFSDRHSSVNGLRVKNQQLEAQRHLWQDADSP